MSRNIMQPNKKRRGRSFSISFITILLFLTFLALLSSCSEKTETTLERAKREGFVRVGYANDIPFAYVNNEGRLTGEAPEIARRILSKMGIGKIEGVLLEFGSLIPALKSGRIDMISSMMFVLPERCKQINFSEPTCALGQGFFVKNGNPLDLHSYEDIVRHSSAVLCGMKGTAAIGYAQSVGVPMSRIFQVPDTSSGIAAIKEGDADAFAVAGLTLRILIDQLQDPEIEMAEPFTGPMIDGKEAKGYGAFGFRKEDTDFLEEFNNHLKKFVGTPAHLETVTQFSFTTQELPGEITTAELCRQH